mmetsp:Transcript_134133/g.261221  ORF Transcript_134133/g.261221 Transcript_134133/m.261221 type:complete len:232 (-) Transcript_134133:973-1668(-)
MLSISSSSRLSSSTSLSRIASPSAMALLSSSISSAALLRFCFASPMDLSHHPFCSASAADCFFKRSISSSMSCLTLAKGSLAISVERAVNAALRSKLPLLRSKETTICRLFMSLATGKCLRTLRRCRKPGGDPASSASAAASTASMASSLEATASATCNLTACWANRIVAPDVFSETAVLRMSSAAVRADSSSARVLDRTSHVLALSLHIFESSIRYSWSSRIVADTTVSC